MDGKALDQLRLDRRLMGRAGWASEDDLAEELANLPDAADKVAEAEPADGGEAEDGEAEGGAPLPS